MMLKYSRVVPRDLFNEAKLLKCMGAAYIQAELTQGAVSVAYEDGRGEPFAIGQNQDDGSLYCLNVRLRVAGSDIRTFTPLNSRAPYPLYASIGGDDVAVFNDDGSFSEEFLGAICQ